MTEVVELSEVTYDAVVTRARAEVAEAGEDYVYPRSAGDQNCLYFDPKTGAPDCVVGRILINGNFVSRTWLHEREGVTAGTLGSQANWTDDVREFLVVLQDAQDRGETWGYALRRALYVIDGDEDEDEDNE